MEDGEEKNLALCAAVINEPFAIWFGFLIPYFQRYLERSGGVLARR